MENKKKEKILKLISNYCNECEVKEMCCADECILWNIEKVVTKEE